MKTTTILLSYIIISTTSCGQSNSADCEKTLDRIPYFATHNAAAANDSVLIDFKILKECGQLDSIDRELINGPMLGSIMVRQATQDKKVTYRSVLESINEFKKTADYKRFREAKILENKIVNISDWEKDKQLLLSLGVSESETESLKEFILMHPKEKMTYKEAYMSYMASKPKEPSIETARLKFTDLGNFENAVKLGKLSKKNILIYFTCYACVNARKMEDNVLTNVEIKDLITNNYLYYSAYVDDKTRDPNDNLTIGSKYMKLQAEKFKSNYQPQFVIVDENGEIIATQNYTSKTDEFIEFLKKGRK